MRSIDLNRSVFMFLTMPDYDLQKMANPITVPDAQKKGRESSLKRLLAG